MLIDALCDSLTGVICNWGSVSRRTDIRYEYKDDYIIFSIVYSKIAILEPPESYICSTWYHELPVCPPNVSTIINERMKRKRQKLNPPSRKSCPEGSPGCSKRSGRPCSPSSSRPACGCSPPRPTRPQPGRPRPGPAPRRHRSRCS